MHRRAARSRTSRAPRAATATSRSKDPGGGAALRCAMFRRAASLLDFAPVDGQRVELRGRLAVYEPRGELQFIAEAMQSAGAGALYERFLRLRARLEAEGLFDPALKRPLPRAPARDRRRHLARRRGAPRRRDDAGAPLAARPGRDLSERRPGHRRAGGALRGDRARRPARRGRHPRRLSRRRLARGPLGLQRRARRARDPRGADARRERRRPRDRRHPRRSRRRPARADADRGRRARRAGDGGAAADARRPRAAALARRSATHARDRRRNGSIASPCAWRARPKRWRGAARPRSARAAPRRRAGARPGRRRDRVPTRPRLACATRSRSRARASPRGSTLRPCDCEALDPQRVLARGYALLVDRDDRPITSVDASGGRRDRQRASRRRHGPSSTTTAIEPAGPPR